MNGNGYNNWVYEGVAYCDGIVDAVDLAIKESFCYIPAENSSVIEIRELNPCNPL